MITFKYKNHLGEIEDRQVAPRSIRFLLHPGYGYQPGWFLIGYDQSKHPGALRSFTLSHIVLPSNIQSFTLVKGIMDTDSEHY